MTTKTKKKTMLNTDREFRTMEIRVGEPLQDENESMIVEGYAVRFNDPTVLWEYEGIQYKEVILPDALKDADLSDVPFKYNHSDTVMIMARTRNKTLQLLVDDEGLFIRAELADTTAGRDLFTLIKRGDIDKMSFAFIVTDDEYDRETNTRIIKKIKRLYDVAAVDLPAYDNTSISARSFFELEREKEQKLESINKRKKLALRLKISNLLEESS